MRTNLNRIDELGEDRLLSDPYAGIFFSKDRTEQIIEEAEEAEWIDTMAHKSSRAGHASNVEPKVLVLGMGAWMKGCPEGSE